MVWTDCWFSIWEEEERESEMNNKFGYGLNLRLSAQQKKKQQPAKPPRPPPFGFNDEDEDDVERDISRQASKNKSLKDVSQCPFGFDFFVMFMFLLAWLVFQFLLLKIEEQRKKALAEDPTVFDYDGVYDEMKEKAVRPRVQDREEKKVSLVPSICLSTLIEYNWMVYGQKVW